MYRDSVSDILCFVFDDGGLVMTLGAFFDESIRDRQGSEPIAVAGYIFKTADYRAFKRAWGRMLKSGPKPTTHFHMTNLYARDHEYRGWSVDDRAEVLRLAVEAVKKHAYCGISVMFSQEAFERLAPTGWVVRHGSMYSAGCQMALRATAYWMDQRRCFTPIAYAFESGHKFWKEADALLKGTETSPELKRLYRYKTHFSLDKAESYGLQAADMLSWIMTRGEVGFPVNHTMRAFGPLVLGLVKDQSDRYQLFHPDDTGLHRFFQEQVKAVPSVWVDHPSPYKRGLR